MVEEKKPDEQQNDKLLHEKLQQLLERAKKEKKIRSKDLIDTLDAIDADERQTDMIYDALEAAGVDATVFPGISANPLLSQCQAAAFTAETCKSDFIVGIGGGSPLDAAKAVAALARQPRGDGEIFSGGWTQDVLPVLPYPRLRERAAR